MKSKDELLDAATAARVAQADQKGWTSFTKELQASIRSLVLPVSDAKKKPTRSDQRMGDFFRGLAAAKGRNQTK